MISAAGGIREVGCLFVSLTNYSHCSKQGKYKKNHLFNQKLSDLP